VIKLELHKIMMLDVESLQFQTCSVAAHVVISGSVDTHITVDISEPKIIASLFNNSNILCDKYASQFLTY
jgi:hypothetical protein